MERRSFDFKPHLLYHGIMKPRRWSDEDLRRAVAQSKTYREVLLNLGLSPSSNRTHDRIRYRCDELNIDRSHFTRGGAVVPGQPRHWKPDEEIFSAGTPYTATTRRRYLKLYPFVCTRCGISEWCGEDIVLQVDHIDGDKFNNSLDNLCLLCPNCHSQTPTWGKQKSLK